MIWKIVTPLKFVANFLLIIIIKKNQKFRFYIIYKIFKSSFSFEVAIPWDQNGMEEATNANVNFLR